MTLADIKPTFGGCAVLAGKALTVNMLEVNCFQTPTWGDMSLWNVQGPLLHSGDHIVPRILTVDYTFNP